ncbi:hypothetical protein D3C86_1981430 [compost metagenome]
MKRGGYHIMMLTQNQTVFALLNNAARAAKPGVGLRRDKAIRREIARNEVVARDVIVAKRHLYLTR